MYSQVTFFFVLSYGQAKGADSMSLQSYSNIHVRVFRISLVRPLVALVALVSITPSVTAGLFGLLFVSHSLKNVPTSG